METAPEIPDVWSHCEIHGYDGDLLDIFFLFTDTGQKIKFESTKDNGGAPVAKITPRGKADYEQREFKRVFQKVCEDCPSAEIIFY